MNIQGWAEIAQTLGLTAEYREADFAKIIPSIEGGAFNVGMSSFTDTKEREAAADFVVARATSIMLATSRASIRAVLNTLDLSLK